jgi:hypothetical protein
MRFGKKKKNPYIIIKILKVRKGRRKRVRANHTHISTNYHNEYDG